MDARYHSDVANKRRRSLLPWMIALGGAIAGSVFVIASLGSWLRPEAADALPTPDAVMRERMSMLTRDRGMTWMQEPDGTIIGMARDARLTFTGVPVSTAVLVVPATTPDEAWDALVQYNVSIEAALDAPPSLTRGWAESEVASWDGVLPLDLSISEFGFDLSLTSEGQPRKVTLVVHRNPGAWTTAEALREQARLLWCPAAGAPPVTRDQMLVPSPCEPWPRGSTDFSPE